MQEKIAVSGVGCLSALGVDLSTCMTNLFLGLRNLSFPTQFCFDLPAQYPVFQVENSGVDWPQHLENLGRTAQLAAVAAAEAIQDSGYSRDDLQQKKVGVCIGTTVGNSINNEEMYRKYHLEEQVEMSQMNRYLRSNPAEVIAREYGCCGPVMTIANACSSGTDAIGIGRSWLKAGLCDLVLAGGADELSAISYLGFISLMISSERSCAPFDRNRKGLNLGEGAAVLVLEKEEDVKKKRCSVAGYSTACDAYHVTAPHPGGRGLLKALGGVQHAFGGTDLGFINAHGTGTFDNDKVEMKVFNQMFPTIPYFSTKGCTGHTLGAAGAIEAAITIGCLQRGEVPKSIGFGKAPDGVVHSPVSQPQEFTGKYGLSQSLAFGGNNSVVVFEKV